VVVAKVSNLSVNGGAAADVAVIGGGPVGLLCAIALKTAGIDVLLVAPQPRDDHRTSALLAGSVTALTTLGVWENCRTHAAPLVSIRIVDATGRIVRAPEVMFRAEEIDLDAFGYNIENHHLIAALAARAAALKVARVEAAAQAVTSDSEGVTVALGDGVVRARLAIGADGARSLCRAAAGIGSDRHAYPQSALTLNLAHDRPHGNGATEFHTEHGPLTLVPLPGERSSVVCVLDPATADALSLMSDAKLSTEIERRAYSLLGKMRAEPGRGLFPLATETANSFARARIALVGEAAHVVPPIGAQGLNLGLRDAATLAEIVADARRQKADVGAADILASYDGARRTDAATRRFAVDVLNRTLLTDFLPVQSARGLSLFLLDRVGPLRRALMREGVAPGVAQPRLMRGELV
jgi:2-octaprenyl-6-methoxyphenol hydroxylase